MNTEDQPEILSGANSTDTVTDTTEIENDNRLTEDLAQTLVRPGEIENTSLGLTTVKGKNLFF